MTVTLNRRALAAILLAVGGIVLIVGLFLGFGGISSNGVSCGSAFKPDTHDANVADLTTAMEADSSGTSLAYSDLSSSADACKDATSNRKPIAWALTIPGILLVGAGALLLLLPAETRTRETATTT